MADASLETVLIVDDEPLMCELLESWTRRAHPGQVLTAGNAEEAVALLRAWPVAVALCDRVMPGLGGDWLVQHVRDSHGGGHYRDRGRRSATTPRVATRRVGYLVKPFNESLVADALQNALAWHRVAARKAMREPF